MAALDRLLGRFTMYRLVVICLLVLAGWSLLAAVAGWLDPSIFEPPAMLLTLVVLLAAALVSNEVGARLARVQPHRQSAVITALLLWFLYWPAREPSALAWLAGIALLANVSKYVLAVRRRHVVNPAAAGVVLSLLIAQVIGSATVPYTTWWVANSVLLPAVTVAAFLVLRRTRRTTVAVAFAVLAVPLLMTGLLSGGESALGAAGTALASFPVVFFAGFMLSEPLTLPPRRSQQLIIAGLAAIVFALPLWLPALTGSSWSLGPFESTYELALVLTGLVAFGFGQRGRIGLTLRERRPLGDDVVEYWFRADRPLRFVPGQYLELSLPHHRADRRGSRRMLSIASAPGPEVAVAVRHVAPGSSFKRSLASAEPGSRWAATAIHGDFVLPRDVGRKVLMVAGGIGITPFMSQLRAGTEGRDIIVVYGVRSGEQVPYARELAELGVDVRLVVGDALTLAVIEAQVPDLAERIAYISGSPAMVDALRRALRPRALRVRVDHFLGY